MLLVPTGEPFEEPSRLGPTRTVEHGRWYLPTVDWIKLIAPERATQLCGEIPARGTDRQAVFQGDRALCGVIG